MFLHLFRILLLLIAVTTTCYAQDSIVTSDVVPVIDSVAYITDSIAKAEAATLKAQEDSIAFANKIALEEEVADSFAAHIQQNVIAHPEVPLTYTIEKPWVKQDYTFEFLLVLLLVLIPALFKFINPSYFRNIFIAFQKPNLSARSLKEQLSQNSLASLVMDAFACISIGVFIYSIIQYSHIQMTGLLNNKYILCGSVIAGVSIFFVIKYAILRLYGFVFGIQEEINNYSFNIFLINKVLAVVLLPFTAVILLNNYAWIQALILIALIIAVVMLLNSYLRANGLFKYFISNSIFHFFMYLCTSELIPLLIIYTLIRNYIS